jgi:hypothetical protein
VFDDPENTCRTILAPYAETLWRIPHSAWDRFDALPDRAPLVAQPRVRANVVWAYMLDEANEHLVAMEGVKPIDAHGTRTFLIEDDVLVRFKLLDADGRSRNYPTRRARNYNLNYPIEGISPSAIRVDLGYKLNELQTAVSAIEVSHRAGHRVAWRFSLDQPAEAIVFPIQPTLDATPDYVPVVRPRRSDSQQNVIKLFQATDDE